MWFARGAAAQSPFLVGLGVLAPAHDARAEFKLHYPIVDYREFEFEHNGDVTFDRRNSSLNNGQSYTNEIGYGVKPWWEPEIEGEWAAAPGQNLTFEATTFENTFQLAPQGKYWADLGFFAEYSHAAARADADSFTFGPLIQKELNDVFGFDSLHSVECARHQGGRPQSFGRHPGLSRLAVAPATRHSIRAGHRILRLVDGVDVRRCSIASGR